jgi:hypothetical protein
VFRPKLRVLVIAYFFTFSLGDLAENLRREGGRHYSQLKNNLKRIVWETLVGEESFRFLLMTYFEFPIALTLSISSEEDRIERSKNLIRSDDLLS